MALITRSWAVLWHSKSRLDGDRKHLMYENRTPALFKTRREARAWIDDRVGYIRGRADLRREPHGWRVPKAVRVTVTIRRD